MPLDGLEGCNHVLERLWGIWLLGRMGAMLYLPALGYLPENALQFDDILGEYPFEFDDLLTEE